MLDQMKARLLPHPIVGDVRGRGLMLGFELVKDKATKEPFDPKLHISARLDDEAFMRGLITYPCAGAIDGWAGDMTLLAPPLIITREQVDEIVGLLDESLAALERGLW